MKTANPTGPHHFNLPAWISPAPFEQLLGIEILAAESGEAILRMPFSKKLAQGAGLMHGGALVSLADTAVVMAIKSILSPGTQFVTTSLESRFLCPVTKGMVTAKAAVVESQDGVLNGSCDIIDDAKRLVMGFTSTFKIVKNRVR